MKDAVNSYLAQLKNAIDGLSRDEIMNLISVLEEAKRRGKFIYIMGNGGSASTASHFVCDFNKGMSYGKDKRYKMICLNDNVATMLAYSNDVGYEDVFVEQLKNFLSAGDVVIGISGSGNSKNVLKAIDYANSCGAITVGITGFDGGILKNICKYTVNANVNSMQVSEDIHMALCHLIHSVLMNKASEKEECACG